MMSISILPEVGVMPGTSVQLSVAVALVMSTPAGAAGAEGAVQLSVKTEVSCVCNRMKSACTASSTLLSASCCAVGPLPMAVPVAPPAPNTVLKRTNGSLTGTMGDVGPV